MNILTVGRISPTKNYDVLLGAVKILKEKDFNFNITIVGEAGLEQDKVYEERIRRECFDFPVQFVGKKIHSALPAIYRAHDLFVHMSQTGSLDRALLEAMACGMKVLSCNDASRGFLPASWIFSPNNAKELAEKIQNYPKENFDARKYVVEHHDLKKLIATLSNLL